MKLDKCVVYKIPFVKNFFCRSGSPGHPGDYGRPVALYGPPLHGSQRDCDSPWRAPCWGTFSSCRPFFSCSSPWAEAPVDPSVRMSLRGGGLPADSSGWTIRREPWLKPGGAPNCREVLCTSLFVRSPERPWPLGGRGRIPSRLPLLRESKVRTRQLPPMGCLCPAKQNETGIPVHSRSRRRTTGLSSVSERDRRGREHLE